MGKHYFLTAILSLFMLSASAQMPNRAGLWQKNGSERTETKQRAQKMMRLRANTAQLRTKGKPLASVVPANGTLIAEQPAGTLHKNMSKAFMRYENAGGYLYSELFTDISTDIVEDGNTIYIRDPFSLEMYDFDSHYWVKATKTKGDTVVVKPQPVFELVYADEEGNPYKDEYGNPMVDANGNPLSELLYTTRMNLTYTYDEDWEDYIASIDIVKDNQDIKFVWRNDSLILVDMAESELFAMAFSDGFWGDVAECNTVISKPSGGAVKLPAGLTPETWQMRYTDEYGNENGVLVNVALAKNTVYLGNLPGAFEGSWTKGTVDGNNVYFASKQYMGVDPESTNHIYFFGGYMDQEWDEEWEEYVDVLRWTDGVTFKYDAVKKTLQTEENIVTNIGNKKPNMISMVQKANMRPYIENNKPTTPPDPVFTEYSAWTEAWPIGIATFLLPRFDAEGNYLNPEKMYYNVYLDDELMVFYPDEYPLLEEETTDVPCTYIDHFNTFCKGSSYTINFYASGYEKFGVQLFYTNGGETRSSKIVYYDEQMAAAIGNVAADNTGTQSVTYTDLFGRRVSHPAGGIYVKSVRTTDGSVKTSKVLVK